MDPQNDFFTIESLATFAGAVGATTVVANSFQMAFRYNPSWLALAVAEAICLLVVFFSHQDAPVGAVLPASDYFVAAINGFLVFCSAAGSTQLVASATGNKAVVAVPRGVGPKAAGKPPRRFWASWF